MISFLLSWLAWAPRRARLLWRTRSIRRKAWRNPKSTERWTEAECKVIGGALFDAIYPDACTCAGDPDHTGPCTPCRAEGPPAISATAAHTARARAWAALSEYEQERRLRERPSLADRPELLVACPVHSGCGRIAGEPCDR